MDHDRYVLTGPPGEQLAAMLTLAVDAGVCPVKVGPARYTLETTPRVARNVVSQALRLGLPAMDELGDTPPPPAHLAALKVPAALRFVIALEQPPDHVSVVSTLAKTAPWLRMTVLHGAERIELHVARAIDLGLTVEYAGTDRYEVTGPTSAQIELTAAVSGQTPAAVRKSWRLTIDQVAIEDDGYAAPVTVEAAA